MTILESIIAFGHVNVSCIHNSTIEITKENYLTDRGTCVLGINSSKACSDLDPKLKLQIWEGAKIEVVIQVEEVHDKFYGFGSKLLPLSHEFDLVFRKSDFICDRTVLINCSKSSRDLDRNLVKSLTSSNKEIKLTFNTTR
ncbi:MAG: DUF371 domain-containing protein [Candidatus Lokiarchaeota archaeon]|nr:DUF371 domain-containing protein [Candidatus Lokiarchaeota archaeon]